MSDDRVYVDVHVKGWSEPNINQQRENALFKAIELLMRAGYAKEALTLSKLRTELREGQSAKEPDHE